MPRISSALVSAKTLRMSSSTMRMRLPWNTESAVRSWARSLRVATGRVAYLPCRNSAGSSPDRPPRGQERRRLVDEPLGRGDGLGVQVTGELLQARALGSAQRLGGVDD